MKHKKDISDLIRENQHKLNERPSPRAWRRLESKLDNQRSRHQTSVYKQFAMVAAVIALVAVASLITLTIGNQPNEVMAHAKTPSSSFATPVQELETIYTDANEDLHKVVEFQRSLKRIYASNPNPITEGTQRNKVVAANDISKSTEGLLAVNDTPSKDIPLKFEYKNDKSLKSTDILKDEIVENSSQINATKPNKEGALLSQADAVVANVIEVEEEEVPEKNIEVASIEKREAKDEVVADAKVQASPAPPLVMKKSRKKTNAGGEWFLGTWKYDDNLKRSEKFHILHKNGNSNCHLYSQISDNC